MAEFARRLQGQSNSLVLPLMWLEQRLVEQAVTVEQLMQVEGQQQAADQVSIGNSIGSLRFLGAMDWREFVESLSLVEQIFRGLTPAEAGESGTDSRGYRSSCRPCKATRTFTAKWISRCAIDIVTSSSGSPSAAGYPKAGWPRRRSGCASLGRRQRLSRAYGDTWGTS